MHLVPLNPDFMDKVIDKGADLGEDAGAWKKAIMCLCGNMDGFPYHEDWMSNPNVDGGSTGRASLTD
jgi:hypothetical protein